MPLLQRLYSSAFPSSCGEIGMGKQCRRDEPGRLEPKVATKVENWVSPRPHVACTRVEPTQRFVCLFDLSKHLEIRGLHIQILS